MRRVTAAVAAVACLAMSMVLAGAAAAGAQPTPTVPAGEPGEGEIPEPEPGTEVCTITDYRLVGLSGLVATDDGYIVVNDGSAVYDEQLPIFFLDQACQVVDFQAFWPGRPYDPEDLVYDHQRQVLWVADTGDNAVISGDSAGARPAVAFWQVDLSGGDRTPVIYRFSYPDGPRDAEAILLDDEGIPIIVTKTVGAAELYRPAGPLVPDNPAEQAVPLEKVGEVDLPETDSEHEYLPAAAASRAVTGGAVAPDGSRVVLRTYTDAFEFDVPDGDVVAAVTDGEPRITPLPGEPFGEAITYSPDGERFLTVSDQANLEDAAEIPTVILSYVPTPPAPPPPPETQAPADEPGGGGFSLVNDVQDIINLIAVVGVVGLLLVATGVYGIVRARRRAVPAETDDGRPVTGRARLTGDQPGSSPAEQGAAAERGAAAAGGVYTSRAVRGEDPAEDGWYGDGRHPGGEYPDNRYGGTGAEPPAGTYAGGTYTGGRYAEEGYPEAAPAGYAEDPRYHAGGEGGYPADAGYGYAGGPAGQEYGYPADPYGHGGTPDQPFDQDWPDGTPHSAAHPDQGYPGQGYPDQGYPGHGYPDQGYPGRDGHRPDGYPEEGGQRRRQPDGAGTYTGGGYEAATPDYYSDDPDYPYEFRGR